MKEKIFIFLLILCFISAGFMPSGTEKTGIIGNATADYVDASNNTNCIEPDPLVPGWSKEVILSKIDQSHSNLVDICVNKNGVIHVVWEEQGDPSGYVQIYYSRSSDLGGSWSEPRRITSVSTDYENRGPPRIYSSQNNTLHLVWVRWMPDNREIYYMRSGNAGITWDNETRLTNNPYLSVSPRISCHNNYIYVAWNEIKSSESAQLWFRKSSDNGESWSEPINLTDDNNSIGSPSIYVASTEEIYIVWQAEADRGYNVQFIRGSNNGESWSPIIPITNETEGVSLGYPNPEIVGTPNGALHVVWMDEETSSESIADISYSRSNNFGSTWSAPFMLTSTSILTRRGNSGMPHIISDNYSNLYVVWKCSNYTVENDTWIATSNDVYFTYSADDGESWKDIVRLTQASGWGRSNPIIVVDLKEVAHVIWGDGGFEKMEICYKRSLNPVTELSMIVSSSLNQTSCKAGKTITVSGNAVYNDSIVPNADVSIKILETGDEWNTTTDSNGDYSISITAPGASGNYTIRVTIASGNHTGWKMMRLTVEQESTNGGTTNGGQQPDDEENKYGINLSYVVGIAVVIAVCIILGFVLVKCRGKTAVKPAKEKVEKPTMGLRCPKCRKTFRVELKEKPFSVKCPYCGKEGTIK
ncbi:MAG: exo-alpha-sialidase [Thermoplasmatales archaeon]|nr:exo-alpha-sialidase [Thermoplasmatales archaeon]